MIEVAFCADTSAELRAQLLEFLGLSAPAETVVKVVVPKAEAKPVEVVKPEPVKAEAPKAAEPTTPAVHPTYKEIADYVPKAISKHGRPAVVAFFAHFGVKNGKELKIEQYPEALAKLKADLPL